ncbi:MULTISPECIES: TRAP transporter substrate-binding protein DctP [unclassified Halomonas]|uniref:TRAP transporter substrate-binding protein DctP n=1 Tax=unclassified Halomonas TaxID=2609666 RepID=UPI0018D20223|nr:MULTISPECIES: TRAP transporter substrate-binding protein DctP [unclassified Halomonas]QPP50620.1 TRAP transporter substrate-binding protein DctP [Halomonas sp. SS10-MC5]
MKTIKQSLVSSLIIMGTAAVGGAQAADWTGYTYSSVSTTAAVKGMERITDRVESEAEDLSISLHLGKTLQIASSDITQSVGDGFIDFSADLFFSGNVPIARILNLPMLIENGDQWDKAYEAMLPYLEEGFAKQDVVFLGAYRYPQQVIFTSFEIDSLDDLENRKIRVTSPEQGAFVEAFGGSPITLSGSDVPTALERGVIDGVLTASAGGAKNWHEFLDYNYRLPVNYAYSAVIANNGAYESLSEADRETLATIVSEETTNITEAFLVDEQAQKQSQAEAGMTIIEPSDEDIAKAQDALAPFWQEWASDAGPEHEQALQDVLTALGK